ncbi:hypothetical protein [Dishui Lake phycodnavirus 2]|nr:hypothetical protein [Dishui Lake phycodnavirus 2]
MSLSGVNAGYLDVRNAILRVGTLDVQTIVSGVDTATNIAKTNPVLLWDDQGSDLNSPPLILSSATRSTSPPHLELGGGYGYAGIKLPNAWLGAFEVYMSDKTDGSVKLHMYTTDTTTYGDTGYELVLDNSGVTLNYDGVQVATAAYTWTNSTWTQVVVGFERGAWTVSVGGAVVLVKDDVERTAVYANVGQYIRFDASDAATTKRVRYIKVVANGHWLQSNVGTLSYTQGNVVIGAQTTNYKLDVRGTANVGILTSQLISVTNSTQSTSKDTGALIVSSGGLGVESNLHSTNVFAASHVGINTTATTHNLDVRGTANVDALTSQSINVTNATHSTSKDTGALIVAAGGLGVEANTHSTNVFAASHIGIGTVATAYNFDVRGTANVGAVTMNSNVYAKALPVATVASNIVTWNSATGDLMDSGGLISNKLAIVSEQPPAALTGATTTVEGHGRYVVAASTGTAYNAFDKSAGVWTSGATYNASTGAYTGSVDLGGAQTVSGEWLSVEFPYKTVLRHVTLLPGGTVASFPGTAYIYGTNDNGTTWTLLKNWSGETAATTSTLKTFTVNASAEYKKYALVVNATSAGSTTTQVGEWRLYTETFSVDGGKVNMTGASGLETGFTEHPVAPMTGYHTYVEGHGTYEASESSVFNGTTEYGWKIFDYNIDTSLATNGGYDSSTGAFTSDVTTTDVGGTRYNGHWVQIKTPYPITLSHSNVYPTNVNRSPVDSVILGSNDGENWYKLTEFTGQTYSASTWKRLDVNATTPYQYYRMCVTKKAIGDSVLGIREWRLFAEKDVTKFENVHISGDLSSETLQTGYIKWPRVPLNTSEYEGYVASASSSAGSGFVIFNERLIGKDTEYWTSAVTYSAGVHNNTVSTTDINGVVHYGEWVQIQLPQEISLSFLKIYPRKYDLATWPLDRVPKDGSVLASNDGIAWTTIYKFSGIVYTLQSTLSGQRIDIASSKPFKYYRLVCTTLQYTGQAGDRVDMMELQLFEAATGVGGAPTSAKLQVHGSLGLAKGSSLYAGDSVVAEFPKHDRPLTKYPEVAMTSTSQGGYTVSVSSADTSSNRTTFGAFDGILETDDSFGKGWQTGARYSTTTGLPTTAPDNTTFTVNGIAYKGAWVKLELPTRIRVKTILLSSAYDTNSIDDRRPESGAFLGSNDNITWELITSFNNDLGYTDSVFGQDGVSTRCNSQAIIQTITNTSYYKYIMLVITKIATTSTYGVVHLNELEYYGTEEGDESVDVIHRSIPNKPGTQQLAVYWDANDSNSYSYANFSNVYDLSGNGVTGTLSGVGYDAEYNAWVFDGVNDYITGTINTTTGAWVHSFSFWMNADTTGGSNAGHFVALGAESVSSASVMRFSEKDHFQWYFWGNDLKFHAPNTLQRWVHVVGTYNGGNDSGVTVGNYGVSRKIFIDGKETTVSENIDGAAGTNPLNLATTTTPFRVGSQLSGTAYFDGKIANVRVFSKKLSIDQIRELYEYDAERFGHRTNVVALHKGNLGVGVAQPTARLEVAGADGLQEYPPQAMTGYETYMEGHGVFKTNYTNLLSSGVYAEPTWQAFDRSTDYLNKIWHSERNSAATDNVGFYMGTSNTYTGTNSLNGLYGDYIILESPYQIRVTKIHLKPRINNNTPIQNIRAFTLLANNEGSTWDILTQKSELTSWSTTGYTFDLQNTNHYKYYALVVTQADGPYATLGELRFYGTPAPSSLEDGHLTLGKALTAPRISGHAAGAETPRADRLVVHYDTTVDSVVAGTTVVDTSGNGRNGTLSGGATYEGVDDAFKFDGNVERITAYPSLGTGDRTFSVSFWAKRAGSAYNTSVQGLVYIGGFNIAGYGAGIDLYDDGDMYWFIHDGKYLLWNNSSASGGSYTTFPVNQWVHVTVTHEAGTFTATNNKVYINAVHKNDPTVGGSVELNFQTSSSELRLGDARNNPFSGQISNFKLWNVALTAEEVAAEYALGRTGKAINITDTAVCLGGRVPRAQLDVRGSARFDGNVGIGTASAYSGLEVYSGPDKSHIRISDANHNFSSSTFSYPCVSYYARMDGIKRSGNPLNDGAATDGGASASIVFTDRPGTSSFPENVRSSDILFYTAKSVNDAGNLLGIYPRERMRITAEGYVGIGLTDPASKLELKNSTIYNGETTTSFNEGTMGLLQLRAANLDNARWNLTVHDNDDLYFLYTTSGSSGWGIAGYLQDTVNVANIDFTGQHRSFVEGVPYSKYTELEGLIVSANKNKYFDIDKNVTTGSNAIQISQSLPLVSLSSVAKDKACFGVISGSEDPEKREYSQGTFVSVAEKQVGDTRAFINSVGEGAIWVTNINGPLESGDYITTSNVAGYGMRQDDDILHNYTVAKITMDCDFNPPDIPLQRILKEKANITYWYQLETVDEATWSNLAATVRRTAEETYYTIDEKVQVYGHVDEQSNVFIPPTHDLELYTKTQENIVSEEVYNALPDDEKGNYSNATANTYTYTQVISLTPEVWTTLDAEEQNTYVHGYYTIVTKEVDDPTATARTRTIYQKVVNERKTETEGYLSEVRSEWVNVLDEHGQLQWEDVPTGETEPAYRIRYLDADGNITTRHNEVYRAAFVGCTYHCG